MIPEMAKRLEPNEELLLLEPPVQRAIPGLRPERALHHLSVVERAQALRTLTEHLYSPIRLPLSRIDVFNTLMAPVPPLHCSLVVHMKTMHVFTSPESIERAALAYRRFSYPRSARLADAIIINSESLRSEIQRYLEVDPQKLRLIYEAVDHDLVKRGDPRLASRRHPSGSPSRSSFSYRRCGPTRTATVCSEPGRWREASSRVTSSS